jgi:hypothetical protein
LKKILVTAFLFAAYPSFAEKVTVNPNAAVDKKVLAMPDSCTHSTAGIARYVAANFSTDREKTRAAYVWLATNIRYDVANMFAINFYEKPEEKIAKTLATRQGICADYAALFQEVCTKAGVRSFVVEGYTKQNGFTDYIPHAWAAASVDGEWLLFDPTWGSGYISNGKFVKKLNEAYYAAKPSVLIKSHMPFDYLWQFLNYPVSNQEFYEGKVAQNKAKPFFSYADSIQAYEQLKHTAQLSAAAGRIERNGVKNAMIFDRLHHIKVQLENEQQSATVGLYNGATMDYNDAIRYYNDFIEYRNKQFTPMKPDAEIQAMLDEAVRRIASAKAKVKQIEHPDASTAGLILQFNKSVDDIETHVQEMQEWLKKYFSKGKMGRRSMFYKVTWMGMPLN